MNSKDKGNIAEAKLLSKFVEMGYNVLQPFGDNCRYDLVVENKGKFERVQIKYTESKNDCFDVECQSKSVYFENGKAKNKRLVYDESEIDKIAVYVCNINKMYLFPSSMVNKARFRVRLKPTKNGQKKRVILAEEYEI